MTDLIERIEQLSDRDAVGALIPLRSALPPRRRNVGSAWRWPSPRRASNSKPGHPSRQHLRLGTTSLARAT